MGRFFTKLVACDFRFARLILIASVVAGAGVTIQQQAHAQFAAEVLETENLRNDIAGGNRRDNNASNEGSSNQDSSNQAEADDSAADRAASRKKQGADKWNDSHSILRNGDFSIAWPKLVTLAVLLLVWVRSVDWINRDAQIFELGYGTWNPIATAPFVVALLATFFVPNFIIGAVLCGLAWAVPFGIYAGKHNGAVEPHEKIFTSGWFRYQVAQALKPLGVKMEAERQPAYMKGAPVDLIAMGGADAAADKANLITARQSPGYVLVKQLVADMADRRMNRVLLDYSQEAVAARNLIDGVWHPGEARDRESGDVLLAVMKRLANLDTKERRQKQEGTFGAEYEKTKYALQITTQGTKSGERVEISIRGGAVKDFKTYSDLGMRDKQIEQWMEVMMLDTGVIVFAALPEGGLTTLTDVSMLETDRLMRDFFAIEDKQNPDRDFENIERCFYDSAAGESPATLVPKLSLRYPNVYVCRDLVNEESAKALMREVTEEERLLITTVPAREAGEALLRVLQKKAPHKEFAQSVSAVCCTRLIRLLCPKCKVEYEPTPDLLKKLGIPAGKVEKLYREPKPEEIEKPCEDCGGLLFVGRTGLFEILIVNDLVRKTLLKQPKVEYLRKAAREAGTRTFQEEGILLVARGLTSLSELSRVLKS